jgi:hypothetical protein
MKSARAKIIAALISFPMCCHSDGCGNAIGYAMHSSRSHDAVICVYDADGNVIETHDYAGRFKEW